MSNTFTELEINQLSHAVALSPYSVIKKETVIRVDIELDKLNHPTLPDHGILEITDKVATFTESSAGGYPIIGGSTLKIVRADRSPAECFQAILDLMLEDATDEAKLS